MWFYFWVWMNFFLVVPRNWSFAQKQRSVPQTEAIAIPAATSARFKAGAFCLVVAWLTICFSLRHSIAHYRARNRGIVNRTMGLTKSIPFRFYLIVPLTAVLIAYQAFISWEWKYSLIRVEAPVYVMYAWGYAPPLLIILVQLIYGFASPNEDKELIRQRRERGEAVDRELGLVKKPAWWRRVRGDHLHSMRDKIAMNVHEIGGGRATGRRVENAAEQSAREEAMASARDDDIEMYPVAHPHQHNPRIDRAGVSAVQRQRQFLPTPYSGKSDQRRHERTMQTAASILFPNSLEAERARHHEEASQDGPPAYSDSVHSGRGRPNGRPGSTARSNSAGTTNSLSGPPQQVRSMLDI
jgi:hypothetical protein